MLEYYPSEALVKELPCVMLNWSQFVKAQFVPHSKHTVSVIKTNQLMLYSEIIAVCSQIHIKHINTLFGQNVLRSKHTPSRL